MTLFFIILLIVLGVLFLMAELILLPGVTVSAILSMVCYGTAIYLAFDNYDRWVGMLVIAVSVLVSLIFTILALRSKTWHKLSLNQTITSSSMTKPDDSLSVGDMGLTLSRIAPMGKVLIGGNIYEAKSEGEYIDQKREITVVGFENFNVIVREIDNLD